MTSVGFVPCLPPGVHPGMDAIAHGLAEELGASGFDLRLFPADLRGSRRTIGDRQSLAIDAALAAGVNAIVLFVLDMTEPARAVAHAQARGVPIVAIHKPVYPVSAAIVVPNYHQGVVLAQALSRLIGVAGEAPRVTILGGPDILDDVELVRGAVFGARDSGLDLVNDPFLPEYRNLDDVRGAGRRAAERLLDDFYPFAGWVVFNDETALDALAVLEERGDAAKLFTVSRNGSPEIVEQLERGKTHATFDYGLPEIGLLAGRVVVSALGQNGEVSDSLVAAPPGTLVTATTAGSYVPWSRRVRFADLTKLQP